MRLLWIWISTHRQLLVGTVSLSLWAIANYLYFKNDIRRMIQQRRHAYVERGVKAAKTGKGGRKPSRIKEGLLF